MFDLAPIPKIPPKSGGAMESKVLIVLAGRAMAQHVFICL